MEHADNRPMIGTLLFLVLGPVLWSIQFTAIYGAQSSLCAFRISWHLPGLDVVSAVILVVTLFAAAGATYGMVTPLAMFRALVRRFPYGATDEFLITAMRLLCSLALVAIIWTGLTRLIVPACAQLR